MLRYLLRASVFPAPGRGCAADPRRAGEAPGCVVGGLSSPACARRRCSAVVAQNAALHHPVRREGSPSPSKAMSQKPPEPVASSMVLSSMMVRVEPRSARPTGQQKRRAAPRSSRPGGLEDRTNQRTGHLRRKDDGEPAAWGPAGAQSAQGAARRFLADRFGRVEVG